MPTISPSVGAAYRRLVRDAASASIHDWLRGLSGLGRYLFVVDGIECALEFYRGHWGMEEGGRWRWGRVDAGDPDEDCSGENVLLEVALGRKLSTQPVSTIQRRRDFPVYGDGAEFTGEEIARRTRAAATANLCKLKLHRQPPS